MIERLFVEKGKPAVAVHDHVEKGQLLVSGMYGKEDNPTLVPAKGVIFLAKLGTSQRWKSL
ncbi:hypothetical protein GCM10020331_038740 [Ectobacillus funiculus]